MTKQLNSHQFPDVYKWLGINLSKLGCVMLDLEPLRNMYSISLEGAETALYHSKNRERHWINGWVADQTLHLTLLYGLLSKSRDISKHIKKVLKGWEILEVEIEDIGYFDSPYDDEDYYCIVAHIKPTPELLEGHQRLEFLPHINTFSGYKPHATLCYLSKAQGAKYRDRMVQHFRSLWKGKKLKIKGLNLGK
jgi:2'-5' RNA ligase